MEPRKVGGNVCDLLSTYQGEGPVKIGIGITLASLCLLRSSGVEAVHAQDKNSNTAPTVSQPPMMNAAVVKVRRRDGSTAKEGPKIQEFGEKYEFLEGATRAGVEVQLNQVSKKHCRFGLCLEAPFEVIIPKNREIPRKFAVYISVSVWNREGNYWVELRPVMVIDRLVIAIPAEIRHKQQTLDLFDNLVDEETLLLKIEGINPGTFYGYQRDKFQARPIPNANAKCEPNIPDLVILPKDVPSFQDVLNAVKTAKRKWNAAATSAPEIFMKKDKYGIPLVKAREIVGRFYGIVRAFDKSMEKRPRGMKAKEYWRQRIIANLLSGGAASHARKALADGISSYEIHCLLAFDSFARGQIGEAKSEVKRAFRLDPGGELAYVILEQISRLQGDAIDVDASKLDAQELSEMRERWPTLLSRGHLGEDHRRYRILPWKDVLPLYEEIRKLEEAIPKAK